MGGGENGKNITLIGICKDEGGRRDRNIKGCLVTLGKTIKFYPLKVVDKNWEDEFIKQNNIKLCELYYPPYNFIRTGCKGCPFALHLSQDLKTMKKFFPIEYKQCEMIWKPVYEEYRRIGFRLKKENYKKIDLFEIK